MNSKTDVSEVLEKICY